MNSKPFTPPWSFNPLVVLIRDYGKESIKKTIKNYETEHGFKASTLDVFLQVMLVSCSYDPTEIWLGRSEQVQRASQMIHKGHTKEAIVVLQAGIENKQISLNKRLITSITSAQISKLNDLQNFQEKPLAELNKLLVSFNNDSRFILTKNDNKTQIIEKFSQRKIILKTFDPLVCNDYTKKFHYLHEGRIDDIFAFGTFFEGIPHPFAWVSYAPVGRIYKQHILRIARIDPQNSLELTRAYNFENSPKNTMSVLFSYAHEQMQKIWSDRYNRPLNAILTDVNPNLGFKGSGFRAVGFGLIGQKPTNYHFIINASGKREYVTRRNLQKYLNHEDMQYFTSKFPLLPTKELAVILNGKKRQKPLNNQMYDVNIAEYNKEELFKR